MTGHTLSIVIISSFLVSLIYGCFWFAIHKTEFYFTCSINKGQYHDCKFSSSERANAWTTIFGLLLGIWTTFWKLALISVLQVSECVEKSAVFLLQQSVFMSIIVLISMIIIQGQKTSIEFLSNRFPCFVFSSDSDTISRTERMVQCTLCLVLNALRCFLLSVCQVVLVSIKSFR